MAETPERVPQVASLAAFAGSCSVALHHAISSHHSPQRRVRDLGDEINDLVQVLESLAVAARAKTQLQNPSLESPLKHCARACQEFKQQIKRLSSTTGPTGQSSCNWSSLRYLGEDINGFREILSGYKMTMMVALADAAIEEPLVTSEDIQGYTELVTKVRADLKGRAEIIDEAIQAKSGNQKGTRSSSKDSEGDQLREERQCTQDCLKICTQLSDHISRLRLANTNQQPLDRDETESSDSTDGLQECKASISQLYAEFEAREKELLSKLWETFDSTNPASVSAEDMARLKSEFESTRRSMKMLQSVSNQLERQCSVIDNHATGDAVQFMVSTRGKLLRGKNRSTGWKARQAGGYLDDQTVRDLSLNWTGLEYRHGGAQAMPVERQAQFLERFGHGFKLTP